MVLAAVAALALGFKHVESGPLVRSSYHARDQVPGAELKALRRASLLPPKGCPLARRPAPAFTREGKPKPC